MPAGPDPCSPFQLPLEMVALPTLILDEQGMVLAANRAVEALLDAGGEALSGKPVDDLLYPGDRKRFRSFLTSLTGSCPRQDHLEIRFSARQGRVVWSLVTAASHPSGSGPRVALHIQEVEGLRRMQDRLEFTEDFLRSIGSLAKIGTWELDLESSHLYWSPQTYEIHELDRSVQPKLEDAIQFYAPEAREVIRAAVEKSVRDGTGFDVTLPLITAKGSRAYVRAVGQVAQGEAGPARLYGIFHDVTAETEMREQLNRLKDGVAKVQRIEALGVMTSGIAHDFNNINASIQGNAEILASRLNDDLSRELMADIMDACGHARNLVHRILAFTRNDQKQVREKAQPLHLVNQAVSMTRPLMSSGLEIELDLPDDLPDISVDPYQVEEALVNLIYNAMQALEGQNERGRIRIAVSLEDVTDDNGHLQPLPGHYVVFSVEDNGPGIPEKILKDIFKPFFTTKSEDNVGLGLPMVQEVMKSHGGAVTVDRTRRKGARFQLYFPSDAAGAVPDPKPGLKGARILLVDDEAAFLKMMERALESFGYRVYGFRSPLDALKAFQEKPRAFDLVVTDLDLPWLDGHAVARQVRESNPDIPIILVSGCNWKLEAPDAQFAHFAGILTKPFSLDDLQKALLDALQKKSP